MNRWTTVAAAAALSLTLLPGGAVAAPLSTGAALAQSAAAVTAPSVPTSVAVTTSGTSATLTWAAPSSTGGSAVTGYVVARDGKDSTGFGAWSGTVSATTRSATFNQLVPGATYQLSVRAVNSVGAGGTVTVSVTMTSATALASAPTKVRATVTSTGGKATLTWSPPAASGGAAVTGYRVARDGVDPSGSGAWSTTVPAATRQHVFNDLVVGRTYTLTVRAITSLGAGATASAKATIPASVSGEAMPVGDLSGWKQVFAEDFSSNLALGGWPGAYAGRFEPYDWGTPDTGKQGVWKTSKVFSAAGGVGDYYLHSEGGVPQCAALIPKINGQNADQTYGRYSVRFKVDPGMTNWSSAWLLWPKSDLWEDGEIDWPEGGLTGNINAFAHHVGDPMQQDQFESGVKFSSGWHTATTEWTSGRVRFYLDGKLVGTATTSVPTKPMHWVLQSETAYGQKPTTAGHIQIDWMVQYAQA